MSSSLLPWLLAKDHFHQHIILLCKLAHRATHLH
jgi:hypothetical protein